LTQPFVKRIAMLSKRIQTMRKRVRQISDQLDGDDES